MSSANKPSQVSGIVPAPYAWDFDGACVPVLADGSVRRSFTTFETFSVGIFQWIPRASGKGLKRGKVKERISGLVSDPEAVYRRARERCASLQTLESLR